MSDIVWISTVNSYLACSGPDQVFLKASIYGLGFMGCHFSQFDMAMKYLNMADGSYGI